MPQSEVRFLLPDPMGEGGILNMEMTEVTSDEISPSKEFIVELSLVIIRAFVLETLWMPNPKEVKYLPLQHTNLK